MEAPRRKDAKLLSLSQELRDELWELRYPIDEEQKPLGYVEILAYLKSRDISSSLAGLSNFYAEERQEREFAEAQEFSKKAEMELLKDPNISPEAAAKFAQYCFTAKVAKRDDLKGFVALEQLRIAQTVAEQNERRLKQNDTKLSLETRRIELLEKKAAFADAVKKAAENREGGVTAEEMKEIERQLKLM